MSNVLSNQAPGTAAAPVSSLAAVPRAVWVVVGTLALATAGLGGALVMRTLDKAEPATTQFGAQAQPAQVAAFQQQAPTQLQATPVAPVQPAPVVVQQAPPKPRPVPVQKPVQQAPQMVAQSPNYTPVQTQRAAVCTSCGTVQNVEEVKEKGAGTGLGAVGGAVLGGLLGNQVGGGDGKKVMTVVGAAGGAYAGHQAERHVRATTTYDVQVRMEDGSVRTVRQSQPVAVGTRVTVEGNSLRVGGPSGSTGNGIPARPLQTSGPATFGS